MTSVQAVFDRAFAHLLGHQAVSVASIGVRAGLFAVLESNGAMSPTKIADSLDYDEHLVRVWCRAAYAFELLDVDGAGRYALSKETATVMLDQSHPLYMGGRLLFATAAWEDTLLYPEALATAGVRSNSERDPLVLEAMRATSAPDNKVLIEHVLPQIPGLAAALEAGEGILEIGCGAGGLLLALGHHFPDARLVGVELDPRSADQARVAASDAGLERRLRVINGDANELEERGTYQLVVMNRSLHEVGGPTEHLDVLLRSRDALQPGGWVVVSELPYPDDEAEYRNNPDQRRLAGVQLHEAIVGCSMITVSELTSLLREAGYSEVHVVDQPRNSRVVAVGHKQLAS